MISIKLEFKLGTLISCSMSQTIKPTAYLRRYSSQFFVDFYSWYHILISTHDITFCLNTPPHWIRIYNFYFVISSGFWPVLVLLDFFFFNKNRYSSYLKGCLKLLCFGLINREKKKRFQSKWINRILEYSSTRTYKIGSCVLLRDNCRPSWSCLFCNWRIQLVILPSLYILQTSIIVIP